MNLKNSPIPFSTWIALTSVLVAPIQAVETKKSEMAGYISVGTEEAPAKYNAGFSFYVAAWPLLTRYPGHEFQTGLCGTWMFAKQERQPPKDLYSDIEGGLGWWRDTRFPTVTPKFIMGGVAPNFEEIANGPSHGAGTWDKPKGLYGVAQLSSRLLFPIDGLNIKQGTNGELFGYGYLTLPFTEAKTVTAGKNIPTGDNSWTLFLNTANFKGPVCFFTPYFWSRSVVAHPEFAGFLLDSRPSDPNKSLAIETQYVPAVLADGAKGKEYARIAPVTFPVNAAGDSAVIHRITCYSKQALWNGVKQWFDGGKPVSSTLKANGSFVMKIKKGGAAGWGIRAGNSAKDDRAPIAWDTLAKDSSSDSKTAAYRWNKKFVTTSPGTVSPFVTLPEYYCRAKNSAKDPWVPVKPEEAPAELRNEKFETPKENPQPAYDTPEARESSFKTPGPVAGPFKAHLGDHSVVTYYWYRFADQPALLNADLSKDEREAMQVKVEKLHRAWTHQLEYLAPPTIGKLADLDPAQIVTPPKGFEIGYVPIATRQELDKR